MRYIYVDTQYHIINKCKNNKVKPFFLFNAFQIPENCTSGADCMPMIISWEGTAEIQSGDVLIVEIDDNLLIPTEYNASNDPK